MSNAEVSEVGSGVVGCSRAEKFHGQGVLFLGAQ
jgi:hypothetical protein